MYVCMYMYIEPLLVAARKSITINTQGNSSL